MTILLNGLQLILFHNNHIIRYSCVMILIIITTYKCRLGISYSRKLNSYLNLPDNGICKCLHFLGQIQYLRTILQEMPNNRPKNP